MKRVVILTGDEPRHSYFRIWLSNDERFEIVGSFCEGKEKSLEARTFSRGDSSYLEKQHVLARKQSEDDFFYEISTQLRDLSRRRSLRKGGINDENIVKEIVGLRPDIIACYGSSLIKSNLLEIYDRRFLNAHLGLSPYYRGSGTNVWPLINNEPFMVGATFMYIDAGIDTGNIIHQIRVDIVLGDNPHTIGNRLIKKMTDVYADIIAKFDSLSDEEQPKAVGKLYKQKDFDSFACDRLYRQFSAGMIEKFLLERDRKNYPYIVENTALT